MDSGIELNGYVTVKNGDQIIVENYENALVRQGINWLLMMFRYNFFRLWCQSGYQYFYFGSNGISVLFGKSAVPTVATMDDLVVKVSCPPTGITCPAGVVTIATDQQVKVSFQAVWGAGVLNSYLQGADSLGEVGFYLGMDVFHGVGENLSPNNDSHYGTTYTCPSRMFSRVSLGSNAFVPSVSSPVTVEWTFVWRF
jgi:hypothetical protein